LAHFRIEFSYFSMPVYIILPTVYLIIIFFHVIFVSTLLVFPAPIIIPISVAFGVPVIPKTPSLFFPVGFDEKL